MNSTQTTGPIAEAPAQGHPSITLKVLAGIARWTWRVATILLTFAALTFILVGFSQRGIRISTDPET